MFIKYPFALFGLSLYTKFMNPSTIVLILVFVLTVGGISFQYIKKIGKSFQDTESNSSINSTSLQQQQKQQAQEAEEQRRAYMESVKQKMRDNQR